VLPVKKNLTLSIILKPELIRAENQFIISQIIALGVASYLKKLSIEAKIKWPNDIYVGDKKICGILIENFIEGANLSASIVGIGLNINQEVFESDAPNPTSVKIITGMEKDLKTELESLVSAIYDIYYSFKSFGSGSGNLSEKISHQYHESLYRLDEFHTYEETPGGEKFKGRIVGINSNACLVIEKEDSSTSEYPNTELPATSMLAPALTKRGAFSRVTPPSTSIRQEGEILTIISLSFLIFNREFSINICPPNPGFTDIISTKSVSDRISYSM